MTKQLPQKVVECATAFELNGRVCVIPTPILTVDVAPELPDGLRSPHRWTLRVELMPTKLWFLNRLRLDNGRHESRILKYDAVKDSWNVIARHRW